MNLLQSGKRANLLRGYIPHMSGKVWFITGTSRGFGREWTIAALERGDKVAATARDTSTLDDLQRSTATRCCRSSWT